MKSGLDRIYIEKGLIEANDDKYANLTPLGEMYGIKWIADQFAAHKIDQELLNKVKA